MTQEQNITHRLVPVPGPDGPLEIECQFIDTASPGAPLLVFLHEGLGSVAQWRDWPARLCAATDCRGLVFSRYGYGGSTPKPSAEGWPLDYLHVQARDALPALFHALGMEDEKPILFGHSDGGSIALLYAAMHPEKTRAIAVAAPHIFIEDLTVHGVGQARQAYLETDLPKRFARYHKNPDHTFWAWNNIWLNSEFRSWNIESWVAKIRCPILAMQGRQDEYGTLEQIQGIARLAPQTRLCIFEDCGHSPHKDKPRAAIDAVAQFIQSL